MNMHRTLATILAGVAMLGATLVAQGFNVRTGTWEFTMTMQMSGPMPGVSPEMQRQIQAAMATPRTSRSCVSADDLKSLNLGKIDEDDDDECNTTSAKITPTTGDIVRECTGDEARTETAHFETTGPTNMTARISAKQANGSTSNITMTGRWIQARCTE
jgi:Protein of unknown function (DUF3617)